MQGGIFVNAEGVIIKKKRNNNGKKYRFVLTAYLSAYYNISTENCTFILGGEFYVSS